VIAAVSPKLAELLLILKLGIEESAEEHQSHLMRHTLLVAPLAVTFQELDRLLCVHEPLLIEGEHLLAHLDEDVDLSRFRIELEFCFVSLDYSSLDFLALGVLNPSDPCSNSFFLKSFALVGCLVVEGAYEAPHVATTHVLLPELDLYFINDIWLESPIFL